MRKALVLLAIGIFFGLSVFLWMRVENQNQINAPKIENIKLKQ